MAQGFKTGGRQKGTPNKVTADRQSEIAASGLTPLDYIISVMRDESNPTDLRLDAANKAAPFVHPKLSSIDLEATHDITDTMADVLKEIAARGGSLVKLDDDSDT